MSAKHALVEVYRFTHRTTSWQRTVGGGLLPVREPIAKPYVRWYCACGVVGGRAASPGEARSQHARHANEGGRS